MPSAYRAGVIASLVEQYLHTSGHGVVREHRAAVITAGPPGAGKSTAIGAEFGGFRQIDADQIKDLLLRRSLEDGDYEAQLDQVLPDGHPVMPREISQLFHEEAILAVEVDVDTAHERAMNRWWNARQDALGGGDPLGGRYLNVKRIAGSYWDPNGAAICIANARWTADYARHHTELLVDMREIS